MMKRYPYTFAIITGALPRDSEIEGAIVRIAKTNAILKHPVNKLFPTQWNIHIMALSK